ncbi:MAG: Propanediol utilization protein [Bacillota bacterium]|jgi:propanediol utilization protein|nr:Propanediol utilization protein [Bacillota bacterium]
MESGDKLIVSYIVQQLKDYIDGKEEACIPAGISSRHIHLCKNDLHVLFGTGYELQMLKPLSQPGQFAAKETVCIAGPKGSFEKVRVLGPVRSKSQVEISQTDGFSLGISAPVRESGNLEGAADICVAGPKGSLVIKESVIIAKRHIHMTPEDALRFGVENGQLVTVRTPGEKGLDLRGTVVRVHPAYSLEFHADTDEGNAAGLKQQDQVRLLRADFSEGVRSVE